MDLVFMSTFDNPSMSIGYVGKSGHLFGFLRHYLLICKDKTCVKVTSWLCKADKAKWTYSYNTCRRVYIINVKQNSHATTEHSGFPQLINKTMSIFSIALHVPLICCFGKQSSPHLQFSWHYSKYGSSECCVHNVFRFKLGNTQLIIWSFFLR